MGVKPRAKTLSLLRVKFPQLYAQLEPELNKTFLGRMTGADCGAMIIPLLLRSGGRGLLLMPGDRSTRDKPRRTSRGCSKDDATAERGER